MANQMAAATEGDLADEMGFTEQAVERRLRIVGFGADDAPRIARLRDVVTRHVDEYTSAFFNFLGGQDEAREFMRNRELVDQARRLKREHLLGMVGSSYGLDYVRQRVRLAALYSRGGLDIQLFLGAFHHLLRLLGATAMRGARSADEGVDDFLSLEKVAFFDVGTIVDVMAFQRERLIRRQQEAIRELSTPVLQIRDRLLMLPIIGTIDTHRARMLTEGLLHAIRANRAKVVVMDVTGVAAVDTKVANHLLHTVTASRLMGATVIVTGLSAEVSQTLVNLGVDLVRLRTIGDLQGGIEEAERMLGYRVTKGEPPAALAGDA